MQQQEFVQTYTPLAKDIAGKTGMDQSVVLGLIAQETGWGNHVVGSNIFGISPGGAVAGYPDVPTAANAFVGLIGNRYSAVTKAAPEQQPYMLEQTGYNPNKGYGASVASTTAQVRTLQGQEPMALPDYTNRPPTQQQPVNGQNTPDETQQIIHQLRVRRGAETPETTPGNTPQMAPDPAQSNPSQIQLPGYVSPDGSYVPPQASKTSPIVASTTNPTPSPVGTIAVGPETPGYTQSTVLPIATNNQTGAWAFSPPGMLNPIFEMANRLYQPYTPDSLKTLTPEQTTSLTLLSPSLRFSPRAVPGQVPTITQNAETPPNFSDVRNAWRAQNNGSVPPPPEGSPTAEPYVMRHDWKMMDQEGPASTNTISQNPAPPNMTSNDVARISSDIASMMKQGGMARGVVSDVGDAAIRSTIHATLGPFGTLGDLAYNLGKHYLASRATGRNALNLEKYLQNELSRYLPPSPKE